MIQRVLTLLVAGAFLVAVLVFTAMLVALGLTAALVLTTWSRWHRRRGARVMEAEYRIIESR